MRTQVGKRVLNGVLALVLLLSLVTTVHAVGSKTVAASTSGNESQLTVILSSIEKHDGHVSLVADKIEWYEGEEANRIFAERDPEGAAQVGGALDGYYIVNDSHDLQTFSVSNQATVLMQLYDPYTIQWNQSITLDQLVSAFAEKDNFQSGYPYHLTIKDGQVTQIVQQYIP